MSSLEQPQRVDIGGFAEACKRVKLDETLTVRVVLDDRGKEPLEYLVQVLGFHVTDDLGLVGIGTDLKLYERFVSPAWVKDRYRAVRRIEAILAGLNREREHRNSPADGQSVGTVDSGAPFTQPHGR